MNLPDKNLKQIRTQWNQLATKYKSIIDQKRNSSIKIITGNGTLDENVNELDVDVTVDGEWPFMEAMEEFASSKHNYHPPLLISSSLGVIPTVENVERCDDENNEIIDVDKENIEAGPNLIFAESRNSKKKRILEEGQPSTSTGKRRKQTERDKERKQVLNLLIKIDKRSEEKHKTDNALKSLAAQAMIRDYPDLTVPSDIFIQEVGSDSD